MTYRTHWIVLAMFLPLFLLTAVAKAQPTRTPTLLPSLPDTPGSTATGISAGGVVVGGSLGFPFTSPGLPGYTPPQRGPSFGTAGGSLRRCRYWPATWRIRLPESARTERASSGSASTRVRVTRGGANLR